MTISKTPFGISSHCGGGTDPKYIYDVTMANEHAGVLASLHAKYDLDPDPRPPSAEHGTPPRGLGQKGARSMSDTGSPAQNSPTQTRRGHKAPRQTTARAAGGTAVADSPIVGSTAPDTRTTEPGAEGAGGADATGL